MGSSADERSDRPPEWNLIIDDFGRSGRYNMRFDEALLSESAHTGARFLRLYRWNPPTLSIGRNQSFEAVGRRDVPIVRRPTGGQAVWHEHEVTYAVSAPIARYGSLRNAYCEIHTRLASALRKLGVDAVLAPNQPVTRPRPISCFAAPVGGEILVGGRKLVGSAQVRRRDAFLQHGSILLGGLQILPGEHQETTLAAVLGRLVTFEEVVSAIIGGWPDPFVVAPLAAQ